MLAKKQFNGFLLFEAMVAVIILSVGITVVLRAFNSAIVTVKGIQDYTKAMLLLEQKMFQLEIEGRQKTGSEGGFEGEFVKFIWKVDSTPLSDVNLDKIDLSIIWNTANSSRRFQAAAYLEASRS